MRNQWQQFPSLLRPTKRFFRIILLSLTALLSLFFIACNKKVDYFSYVSELRSNILCAQTDEYFLSVYAVEKEYPYSLDGVKRETSMRTEIRLLAPSGDKTYEISFQHNGSTYGGEMSYDNVRAEYYYSCSLDVSSATEIDCMLICEDKQVSLCAKTVKTENTLSPQNVLAKLQETESELFSSLTDKYGFAGEIYIRLLYEDFPYYYIGVIDRNGYTSAFLMNGETGKILARRQG